MQLEQRFELDAAPEVAWPAFRRIELLVECLPGAALAGPAADGEWPLRFDVKLGPIAAGFVGSGRVSADDATHSGCFEGAATDRRTSSRVKGAASFTLESAGRGSVVRVTVDYTLTGTLAQFSRGGLARELASALAAQFAANLSTRLQTMPQAAVPAGPTESALALPQVSTGAAAAASTAAASTAAASTIATPTTAASTTAASTTAAPASGGATVVPLDGIALLRQIVLARWRRMLGWLRGATPG